uniref:Curli production assembly/transport component CsgG n=1 Tax=Magnetococcus massalia (strain MO-1) TaxID=451514 RepID=A0A1S7LJC3_MAGMO|nr:conserved exported protein of unknown function [Candidatus Magnetococcus massalia]
MRQRIAHRFSRQLKTNRGLIAWLLAAMFLTGCFAGTGRSMVVPNTEMPNDLKIAVLPFENLSNNPNGGVIVSQLMATELYSRDIFDQMEETEVRRTLTQNKIDVNRLADATLARKVGLILGVDAVLIGSVSELTYQHGLREEPAVGFNVQLLRIKDGKVLWRASRSLMGSGWLRRESLIYTAQQAVVYCVDTLYDWYEKKQEENFGSPAWTFDQWDEFHQFMKQKAEQTKE